MTRVDVVSPPPLISFVTDRIATGRGPVSGIELGLLVRAGVTHIIDCRDDPRLSLNVAPGRRLWIPALDDCAPKPAEWFDEAVTFARSALADPDARLFVHCELGINRGPSVAYAILRAVEGLSAEGAASAITAARPVAAMAYVADVEHYLAALDQQPGCPLCDAAPITRRYAETDLAWVADCAVCGVPMVVWRHHGTEPTDAEHLDMLDMLDEVAIDRFGDQRWLVDQERRSIPQHWHAHARPLDFTREGWAALRRRLGRVARLSRDDPAHGWRAWTVAPDGTLVSQERNEVLPSAHEVAVCTRQPGACELAPGTDCYCGFAFFGSFDDALAVYPGAAIFGELAWALVDTHGRTVRDHALRGATWRCERITLAAVVLGAKLAHLAPKVAARYGVPVHTADADTGAALAAVAAAQGLPAVARPYGGPRPRQPVDELLDAPPEQFAGGAWTTTGVGTTLISEPCGGTAARDIFDQARGAAFTWYAPGKHALAFTADEVEGILAAIDHHKATPYGTEAGVIEPEGVGAWVGRRCADLILAANLAWWHRPVATVTSVTVNTYGPGDRLDWHVDKTPRTPRFEVSLVAMLSDPDDYTGGQLQFRHDAAPTWAPQARGTAVLFPSTLLHRVTPITGGRRQVLVAMSSG